MQQAHEKLPGKKKGCACRCEFLPLLHYLKRCAAALNVCSLVSCRLHVPITLLVRCSFNLLCEHCPHRARAKPHLFARGAMHEFTYTYYSRCHITVQMPSSPCSLRVDARSCSSTSSSSSIAFATFSVRAGSFALNVACVSSFAGLGERSEAE